MFDSLDLGALAVAGDVHVDAIEAGRLTLNLSRVDGSVRLSSRVVWNERSPGAAAGAARRGQLQVQDLELRGIEVRGWLWLCGVDIVRELDLVEAQIGGMLVIDAAEAEVRDAAHRAAAPPSWFCRIGGDVQLSALRCRSYVRFIGVTVEGGVRMLNGEVGALQFDPAFATVAGGDIAPTRLGGLFLLSCTIDGELRMPLLRVAGVLFAGSSGNRGITVRHCTIRGDLALWRLGTFRSMYATLEHPPPSAMRPKPWHYSAGIVGDLRISRCTILGDCLLSFAKVAGVIDLGDTHVHGDVMIGSRASHVEGIEGDRALAAGMAADGVPAGGPFHDGVSRAYCAELCAGTLLAENDWVIDGLTVAGRLSAAHAQVRGDLRAWHEGTRSGARPIAATCLEVRGPVDLSFARVNHLLAPLSWRADALPDEHHDVALRHARVETLSVSAHGAGQSQPARFDLVGASVTIWDVVDDERAPDVDRLAAVIRHSPGSIWQSVESMLRRQGDDDAADAIYRQRRRLHALPKAAAERVALQPSVDTGTRELSAMLLRLPLAVVLLWLLLAAGDLPPLLLGALLWTAAGLAFVISRRAPPDRPAAARGLAPWHSIADRFYGYTLGYGTRVGAVVMLLLTLATAALPVYFDRDNFQWSNAALAGKWRNQPPPPIDWNLGNALGALLHHHVPIVGVSTYDDTAPSGDTGLGLCVPRLGALPGLECGWRWRVNWLSPEGFATAMELLNWILWPMLLTFSAVKLWRSGRAGGAN